MVCDDTVNGGREATQDICEDFKFLGHMSMVDLWAFLDPSGKVVETRTRTSTTTIPHEGIRGFLREGQVGQVDQIET